MGQVNVLRKKSSEEKGLVDEVVEQSNRHDRLVEIKDMVKIAILVPCVLIFIFHQEF